MRCEEPLSLQWSPTKKKVRFHNNLTGKYRGAALKSCNLNSKQKQSNFVPVVFQLSGYDCHLIF